jgi:hypothetical protein
MKQKLKNNVQGSSRLFIRLAADNKKAVMAFCLISVMVFMWIKVLTGKAPDAASAAPGAEGTNQSEDLDSKMKVSFVELPKVTGRNDVITRDFFASNGWRDFYDLKGSTGTGEVDIVSGNGSEEVIKAVTEKLKLEAIGLGESPRALINDKMMSVGDKLLIRDGINSYECEVVQIMEDTVEIRCGETEVTLRLIQ